MKKCRYKVYCRPHKFNTGLIDLRPKSFATLEEAEEHAFIQRLAGYKVDIDTVQMLPITYNKDQQQLLRAICPRTND